MNTFQTRNAFKLAVLVLATGLALTAYPGRTGPSPALAAGGGGRQDCWMTGGGSVFDSTGNEVTWGGPTDGRVTHGFELHCDRRNPNNLQINFGGNRFHLETLVSANCSDDANIEPNPPDATFDTYDGYGIGRYNGDPGYCATWTFTDAGEPGINDFARIVITDCNGTTVLSVSGYLTFGDHQAHSQ